MREEDLPFRGETIRPFFLAARETSAFRTSYVDFRVTFGKECHPKSFVERSDIRVLGGDGRATTNGNPMKEQLRLGTGSAVETHAGKGGEERTQFWGIEGPRRLLAKNASALPCEIREARGLGDRALKSPQAVQHRIGGREERGIDDELVNERACLPDGSLPRVRGAGHAIHEPGKDRKIADDKGSPRARVGAQSVIAALDMHLLETYAAVLAVAGSSGRSPRRRWLLPGCGGEL